MIAVKIYTHSHRFCFYNKVLGKQAELLLCIKEGKQSEKEREKKHFSSHVRKAFVTVQWKGKFVKSSNVIHAKLQQSKHELQSS